MTPFVLSEGTFSAGLVQSPPLALLKQASSQNHIGKMSAQSSLLRGVCPHGRVTDPVALAGETAVTLAAEEHKTPH